MTRSKRAEPYLPPGPARDLVDLFKRLRDSSQLRVGQIANRTGYAPGHISEVLRGWKTPSPEAAGKIAHALGADDSTVRRARRRAEDLKEWKRDNTERQSHKPPGAFLAPAVESLAGTSRGQAPTPSERGAELDHPGREALEAALGRAIIHYATRDGPHTSRQSPGEIARRFLNASGTLAEPASVSFPVQYQLGSPDVALNIIVGDIFDQETHIAIGFSDTFDTSIAGDRVIHVSSVQGQLLRQVFAGDQQRLDDQLTAALASVQPVRVESRSDKPHGKLARYPLGTVAVLGEPHRLIFAVAYGRMGNNLVVHAPVEDLWHCYTQLWEAVYCHGQRGPLSIPIMGSGLARVDTLDRENLLRLILLSFVAYSRLKLICHELRIVIFPDDARRVDPVSLSAFLQTL
jgi:transcriptional regulator with XRE-family HTH domain